VTEAPPDSPSTRKAALRAGPRLVTVGPEEAGRRLDNFLINRLKGVPRSRIYRMIRGGEVRVNKGRARPRQRLAAGDSVRIPPVTMAGAKPAIAAPAAVWIERHVIYEDRDLLVLDKPAGLAVHGGSGVRLGVIELLRAARDGREDLSLVHRLDRDTSGCLLVAKRRASLRRLHEQLRDGSIHKQYLALLIGDWTGPAADCDAPLLTTQRRGGERHVRVDPKGKSALTKFRVVTRFGVATLADVDIVTGRTHQIRVHAAELGHPVAGDTRYGCADDPVVGRFGLQRLFLHAAALAFESPAGGRVIRVRAAPGAELERVLAALSAVRESFTGPRNRGG